MNISMDKKYTLDGEDFFILTVKKPGKWPVAAHGLDGSLGHFTADGFHASTGAKLVEVIPYADFKIDDPVMVRDDSCEWESAHFCGVNHDGLVMTWRDGTTQWTADGAVYLWQECRRPTAEELAT